MEFTVEFYETNAGGSPVQEFLEALKASDPDDFAVVLAGLAKAAEPPVSPRAVDQGARRRAV